MGLYILNIKMLLLLVHEYSYILSLICAALTVRSKNSDKMMVTIFYFAILFHCKRNTGI